MSTSILSLPPDAAVAQAAELMIQSRVHRVLVIDEGRLVGVVSALNVAEAGSAVGEPLITLREIMRPDVVTIAPELSVRAAMRLFAGRHISGAPVTAGHAILGVVSATDLMDFAASLPGVPTERLSAAGGDEYEPGVEWEEVAESPAAYFAERWSDAEAELESRFEQLEGPEWGSARGTHCGGSDDPPCMQPAADGDRRDGGRPHVARWRASDPRDRRRRIGGHRFHGGHRQSAHRSAPGAKSRRRSRPSSEPKNASPSGRDPERGDHGSVSENGERAHLQRAHLHRANRMHNKVMHYITTGRELVVTALIATVSLVTSAGAQAGATPVPMPPSASDPPSVAGRIAFLEGAVSYRPAQGDTWALAELNRAVSTGDRLWVDSVGRAEVEIGANALRMSAETEVDITHLGDNALQIRLPQGAAALRLKAFGLGGIYEIDAPNAAVALGQAGEYRIDVTPDGQTTTVTVWNGQARVTAAGSTFEVDAHKVATVQGDSAPTCNVVDAGSPNAFDQWCLSRDEREDRAGPATQYVSADMGGVADLNEYGTWTTEPDYGPVWYPPTDIFPPTDIVIVGGWAPYSYGHWVWEWPWGWVWVDFAPWGWAPFHYGRWAYIGRRWGWCPGAAFYRPVFAPALVGFLGGPGWNIGVGFGGGVGVGWFPLAPHELYFPPYTHSILYRERINATNYTNVAEIANMANATNINYRNRSIAGAVTAVPQAAFQRGEPAYRAAVRVTPNEIASARVLGTTPGVVPTTASLAPVRAAGGRGAAVPPARLAGRSVVALHAPAPTPVPFSVQRQAIEANGGRPLSRAQLSSIRASEPDAIRARMLPARSAVVPIGNHALTPARGGLPPTRPALPFQVPTRAVGVPAGHAMTPLDQEYQNAHAQMETRHVQEFARPPAGESEQALPERQEAEHEELLRRYQAAQRDGAQHLPPPSPPPAVAPRGGGGRPR